MKVLEITDDSGFIGIANFDKYNSFIGENWDFELIKMRIVREINSHHLLFWATGLENTWKVSFVEKASEKSAFREERAVIEVSDKRLYLTNYEALTMAAQFEKIQLPESHHNNLFIDLENGKYMVKFRQMSDPFQLQKQDVDFEIVIQKIVRMPKLYVNNINEIYWSEH